jgi:hypothetical protein
MPTRTLAAFALGLALLAGGCQSTAPDRGADMGGPSPTLAALQQMDPEARAIAERVVEFAGGAKAIDNVQTLEVRFEGMADGNPLVFHLAWSRSGSAWYGMRMGPTEGRMGTNGTHYWRAVEGEGPEMFEIDPEEGFGWREDAEQVVSFAATPMDVINPTGSHSGSRHPLISHGLRTFKGQSASVLSTAMARIVEPGKQIDGHYSDPQTGRPIGTILGLPNEPLYMTFSDWREVEGGNGLKMFHRVRADGFWLGDEVFDLRATIVRVNTLDEADFAPPADAVLQK